MSTSIKILTRRNSYLQVDLQIGWSEKIDLGLYSLEEAKDLLEELQSACTQVSNYIMDVE